MTTRVCPAAEDLMASANALLDATPAPEFWALSDRDFIEFTLPEWRIRTTVEEGLMPPRALLQHRTHPTWWLVILGHSGTRLLTYRGSTMGQFFRYTPERTTFAAGTVTEVVAALKRRFHPDATVRVPLWTLEVLDGFGALTDEARAELAALRERRAALAVLAALTG